MSNSAINEKQDNHFCYVSQMKKTGANRHDWRPLFSVISNQ